MRRQIAVIGAGVSGLVAARLLATRHEVTLIESASQLGGHARTIDANIEGRSVSADVGFMVFNRRTYPNFCRLLNILGIDSQPSDMSFSVREDDAGLEYQSGRLFAQPSNALNPSFLRMLWDILRFNRHARELLHDNDAMAASQLTLGDFVRRGGFGARLLPDYLLPMIAAIWSAPPGAVEAFPAAFLLRFLENHGLLDLARRPQWLTIPGGSRRYVDRLARSLSGRVKLDSPVEWVRRTAAGVEVRIAGEDPREFDAAVFATHAPQTLEMLCDADAAERQVLGAFAYQPNDAALHTDVQFMPRRPRAWASWNFLAAADASKPATVTYDLNRLQRLGLAAPLCVTLNPPSPVMANRTIRPLRFEHPLFSAATMTAQSRWAELHRDDRVYFCGAYWGYGFHEDGVNSALAVARRFGITLDDLERDVRSCTLASTPDPSPTCVVSP